MAREHYNTLRASSLPFSFKKREREQKRGSPPSHCNTLQTTIQALQINPTTPSNLSSVPHLFSGCLISPAGSKRTRTIVSLFNTEPATLPPFLTHFQMPFSEFYNTIYTRGDRTLGSMLLVFFSEDPRSTKASFTACCWGDSFRNWEGRNNMGGVFETHKTTAAVFKGTPGNSCVWSISDYASFQVFWHNYSNNTDLLTSM